MPAAPAAVIDTLNSLLEAELNSIFRFLTEGSPYMSRATAELRAPLNQMVQANQRRARDLAALIERLGGVPVPPSIQPEEQYLAFLTLKFLLPKLVDAKRLMIRRYENALRAVRELAPPEAIGLLRAHIAEDQQYLKILEKAAADLAAKK
jgi:bacterioferritin (cytochrome b1)